MIVVRPDEAAWTVTCVACAHAGAPAGIVGRALPATVPGCVHLDLVRAGIIPPVDEGDGEARRDDQNCCHAAVWGHKGDPKDAVRHQEQLHFENVHLAVRSYK